MEGGVVGRPKATRGTRSTNRKLEELPVPGDRGVTQGGRGPAEDLLCAYVISHACTVGASGIN